ncbi:Secretory carrier-associated membrane protein 2 [Sarracenia purpurea var. burkii]
MGIGESAQQRSYRGDFGGGFRRAKKSQRKKSPSEEIARVQKRRKELGAEGKQILVLHSEGDDLRLGEASDESCSRQGRIRRVRGNLPPIHGVGSSSRRSAKSDCTKSGRQKRRNPTSRLSPFPPEPADFNYDRDAPIDIPLDTATDLKKKEKELKAKEAELRKREQDYMAHGSQGLFIQVGFTDSSQDDASQRHDLGTRLCNYF